MRLITRVQLLLLLLCVGLAGAASAAAMTAMMSNGVTITTTVDTVQRTVTYDWDFTNLAGDYEQVDIGQPLFPATSLCNGCVVSAGLTEYSIFDAGGGNVESVLQLKYEGGNPPSRVNSVVLTYRAAYLFSGTFIDGSPVAPGADGNIVVTYRNPPGGEDATLWAYTPEIQLVSQGNNPPVAAAGADQSVLVGDTVTLDGSGSHDADGDGLTYAWSLASVPAGSAAMLSNAAAVKPTFVVDLPGTYVAQLVVNDGKVDSAPDSVSISTDNSAPVAAAGADQSVLVGDTVTLDGSGSYDADGDGLTYAWSLASVPAGSAAMLSNAAAVKPTFVVDLPGTYVAQLVVNDGKMDSAPDSVSISTDNSAPVAAAGADQSVLVGDTVTLDGSGSHDADGDGLTYAWSLASVPAGSAAMLSNAAAVKPTFVVDLPGTYVAQLIVNDGMVGSAPDSVSISTDNSAPVAAAGADQSVLVGDTVTLDGSGSHDADGDGLTYAWSLASVPAGSAAMLSNAAAVKPTFVVDLPGTYVAQLIVNDGMVGSAPDSVSISTDNSAPVAAAGADQSVLVGDTVTLDGSGSYDADGDGLTYAWSLASVPAGSTATLSNATTVNPAFVADLPGTYVAQLIVNDGMVGSAPDTVSVTTDNANANALVNNGGGGGGGGCSVRPGAVLDPTLYVLLLISLVGQLFRRRYNKCPGFTG